MISSANVPAFPHHQPMQNRDYYQNYQSSGNQHRAASYPYRSSASPPSQLPQHPQQPTMDQYQQPYQYSTQQSVPTTFQPTADPIAMQNTVIDHHTQSHANYSSPMSYSSTNYSIHPQSTLAGPTAQLAQVYPSPSHIASSVSDTTSQSSFSGPPSPLNGFHLQTQFPVDYQYANIPKVGQVSAVPYGTTATLSPSTQFHPQIAHNAALLSVPNTDNTGQTWNYDHSPYSAAAESYSPSSSSNNGASVPNKKFTNACKRCRKQKMKCTFKEGATICTRCLLGSHQCFLEERKSRNPGELEIIRGQLRNTTTSLDQAIDRLREVSTSQYDTPLSFVPGRISLTNEQREELRDVLGNVLGTASGRKLGVGSGMEDVRALLMEEESEESEGSGNESEGEGEQEGEDFYGSEGSENGEQGKTRRKNSQQNLSVLAAKHGRHTHVSVSEGVVPDFSSPLGFIAQATMEEKVDYGGYFQPSPLKNPSLRSILIGRGDEAPPILTHGLFTIKDVEALFELYFKRIHPIVALLDPAIHTPSSVLLRSSFLFTVICAITCRFMDGSDVSKSTEQIGSGTAVDSATSTTCGNTNTKTSTATAPTTMMKSKRKRTAAQAEIDSSMKQTKSKKSTQLDLSSRYPLALHFAKVAAASALIDGRKNVEMVQAYLLMALYAPNGKRFEESRTLFYSGVASTVAVELGLHEISEEPPHEGKDERSAREWHNLVRTWIICFNLDRCYSVQYGKPMALKEDFHVLNKNWYRVPFANTYDLHLHGHTDLLRIMARFKQSIKSEKNVSRISFLIEAFEKEVDDLASELKVKYLGEADLTDEGCCFRLKLAEFVAGYSRLLILSHGLQQSFENGSPPDPAILTKALHIATASINAFVDKITETGFWRYSPDCYFIYSGYCSTFLLKLIDSKFPYQFDGMQKERIIDLVTGLVNTLSSQEIVLDERHTPKLYAGFLAGLLKRVGAEVRIKKKMRVDRDQQRLGSDIKSELSASPPPSSRDSTSISPVSAVNGPGPNGINGSWNGNNSVNGQNHLTAFPSSTSDGNTNDTSGCQPVQTQASQLDTGYPSQEDSFYSSSSAVSPTGWTSEPNSSPGMTWDEVYAAPDGQSQPQPIVNTVSGFSANIPPNSVTGHAMHMGSQWNFNADDLSTLAKWSMEDLVPTVNYLMPNTA